MKIEKSKEIIDTTKGILTDAIPAVYSVAYDNSVKIEFPNMIIPGLLAVKLIEIADYFACQLYVSVRENNLIVVIH